ncbi:MAG: geranylgeranyl diphosphate reductase [Tagaea sp.]
MGQTRRDPAERWLDWIGIVRLGCVQASLGAIVVLGTSTLNRVMIVELALPAIVPGALVALHYVLQILRPRWGYGSDAGGRRTPWIVGGMIVLAAGGVVAATATVWMASAPVAGLVLAIAGFAMIGVGAGCAGTTLLVLLSKRVEEKRRPAAAAIVWIMMIFGFAATAGTAGQFLDPFSGARLIAVCATVSALAVAVTLAAARGLEGVVDFGVADAPAARPDGGFRAALAGVWREPHARLFTIFIVVSMLAYSAQDLILEPFAALVYVLTPGQTTTLSGLQNAGVLGGMIAVALLGQFAGGRGARDVVRLTVAGCLASAAFLAALGAAGLGADWLPIRWLVFGLGVANGAFAIAAIGSMMTLVGRGKAAREGTRMGLWGAAQALAAAAGGLVGTGLSDIARVFLPTPAEAYALVFACEAVLFVGAAWLAIRVGALAAAPVRAPLPAHVDESAIESFDVAVVGGGPAGATAADDLARGGAAVALLDRAGRIKPCGGAIPPRLIRDFAIPDSSIVARIASARMVAPSDKHVDIPIEGGYVGMVDREVFDEWLRARAERAGAVRRTGTFDGLFEDSAGRTVLRWRAKTGDGASAERYLRAKLIVGADGANSAVARAEIPASEFKKLVFAYHEIIAAPADAAYDGTRCDVIYQGRTSPDFYAWIFPHGKTASVGTGSAEKGFALREAVAEVRARNGMADCVTLRREGASIPLKPLARWDNGRDVLLAGDAAGVVAPASGEGIYYAMYGGRLAAETAAEFLRTADARTLARARKRFMRAHGMVFLVLGVMQRFWYSSEKRRESFVDICRDKDVQKLTFDAYMNKELVRAKPGAHARIFFKDLGHLFGFIRP